MKSKEYILVNICHDDEFVLQNISKSGNLDLYLNSKEYDKSSYEFEYATIILIFEANLEDDIKEMIHKSFRKQLVGK
ncbi:hypothetical protein [Acinetobacter bereziniae]|uniref:hypothetical protein n=1 Tax=Acinetobacter bereziniae TaxID=106648 RepID=UPI00300AE9F6